MVDAGKHCNSYRPVTIHAQDYLHRDINILHDRFNIMFIDVCFSRKISNQKKSEQEVRLL